MKLGIVWERWCLCKIVSQELKKIERCKRTSSKADNAASHSQHPKHAVNCFAVRGRGQDAAQDDEQRGQHNGRLAAHVVARQADDDLSDDLANEQSVGHARADCGRVLGGEGLLEEHVGHGHEVVLVAVRDEGEARAELNGVIVNTNRS